MGVVYYANYFVWMEVARTEWFEQACGMSYHELEKEGIFLPVVEANCRYKGRIRYPDVVEVTVFPRLVRDLYLEFDYQIRVEDKEKATGFTRHVFVDKTGKVLRIEGKLADLLYQSLSRVSD